MISIADNSERARRVILFFWILLAAQVVSIASGAFRFFILDQVQSGEEVTETVTALNDLQYGLVALATFGINIAVIVTFIQWFRRAYHNLQRAGYHTELSEAWAAGAWFVPFLNLVRPYKIMKEIWYQTQSAYATRVENHGILRAWWIMCLLRSWYNNITTQMSFKSETTSDFIRDTTLSIFGDLFTIPCIVVTVMMIRQTASFEELFTQQLRIETVGEAPLVPEEKDVEEEYY